MLRKWLQRITLTDVIVWTIGLVIVAVVIWGTYRTLTSNRLPDETVPQLIARCASEPDFLGCMGKYTTPQWFDLIVRGLALGGVYALIALGYTLVYGILRMINFAHSEVFMSGPFTAAFVAIGLASSGFLNRYPLPSLLLITLVSAVVSMVVALLLERIAYRPLRNAPRLVPLITAIGASYFLQYTFRGLYGSGVTAYPTIAALDGAWQLGAMRIFRTQVVVMVSAFVLMLALYLIVQKTKMGKAMRAVSEDKEVSALMGIDVDRVIVSTFAIGGASAGIAGVLYALMFPVVNFFMGFFPGLKAFTAAVLGGIGNVPGAWLGAMILGLLESLGPNLFLDGLGIPAPYQLKDAIAFIILVFILIFRPTGILGERITQAKA